MECRYCQAANADDDHRCRRCGRRLRMSPVYTGSSAAAPVLQYEAAPVLQYEARRFRSEPHRPCNMTRRARACASRLEPHTTRPNPALRAVPITYQPSLFTSRELPLVVQFETIAPGLGAALPAQAATVDAAPTPAQGDSRPASSRVHSPVQRNQPDRPSRRMASFIAMLPLPSPRIAPWQPLWTPALS